MNYVSEVLAKIDRSVASEIRAEVKDTFMALLDKCPSKALSGKLMSRMIAYSLPRFNLFHEWRGAKTDLLTAGIPHIFGFSKRQCPGFKYDGTPNLIHTTALQYGDSALYWDGEKIGVRPYDHLWPEMAFTKFLLERVKRSKAATVIDVFSGSSIFSLLLALSENPPKQIINIDIEPIQLVLIEMIARRYELPIKSFVADMVAVAESISQRERLASVLPIQHALAVTFVSAFTNYTSQAQVAAIMDFIVNDLKAVEGFHAEMRGHKSAAYDVINSAFASQLPKHSNHELIMTSDDPFPVLRQMGPEFTIIEDVDLLPDFLREYLPSYFQWRKP